MALATLNYFSESLGKQSVCNVILPESRDFDGPFPVYYLLHGLSDDYSIWNRRTSIERYVQALPLIVVMPDGGRGFYCDAPEGFAFESAIVKDLIPFVDRTFRTVAQKSGRCIGGLSMGGYGAIKLALKFPELFASANGQSGAYGFSHALWRDDEAEFGRILGPDPVGSSNDCFALAQTRSDAADSETPALRIDCGTEDFLIEQNRLFHAHLETLGIEHEYLEPPGAHEWSYWDKHVQSALRFHTKHLGISKPKLRA